MCRAWASSAVARLPCVSKNGQIIPAPRLWSVSNVVRLSALLRLGMSSCRPGKVPFPSAADDCGRVSPSILLQVPLG